MGFNSGFKGLNVIPEHTVCCIYPILAHLRNSLAVEIGHWHSEPLPEQPLPLPPSTLYNFRIWQVLQSCLPSNDLSPVPELLQQILEFCTFVPRPDSRLLSPRQGLQGTPSTPPFHFLSIVGWTSIQCGVDVPKLWYRSANSELRSTLGWLVR